MHDNVNSGDNRHKDSLLAFALLKDRVRLMEHVDQTEYQIPEIKA